MSCPELPKMAASAPIRIPVIVHTTRCISPDTNYFYSSSYDSAYESKVCWVVGISYTTV